MESITQAEAFFFISSVGFIILGILTGIFLFYLIKTTKSLSKIAERVEKDIDKIGDTTKDMIESMQESMVFRFIFGRKKNPRKNIK